MCLAIYLKLLLRENATKWYDWIIIDFLEPNHIKIIFSIVYSFYTEQVISLRPIKT